MIVKFNLFENYMEVEETYGKVFSVEVNNIEEFDKLMNFFKENYITWH